MKLILEARISLALFYLALRNFTLIVVFPIYLCEAFVASIRLEVTFFTIGIYNAATLAPLTLRVQ